MTCRQEKYMILSNLKTSEKKSDMWPSYKLIKEKAFSVNARWPLTCILIISDKNNKQ